MGAAGNKKPKGMKKKHEAGYLADETTQQASDLAKKGRKK